MRWYLRSPSCLIELHGLWNEARQRGDAFLARVVPLVQPDAAIGTTPERIAHAVYWKEEFQKVDSMLKQYGADVIGEKDHGYWKTVGAFYARVGDMLWYLNDELVPRERAALSRDGFAIVRGLIERALG